MSSKPSTSKDSKLPPMEAILTRNKSAQLKRQLRNKDSSLLRISQITQLLRSPGKSNPKSPNIKQKSPSTRSVSKSPKAVKSHQKSSKKVQNISKSTEKKVEPKEFHRKIKQNVQAKKLLKPKDEMNVVPDATVNENTSATHQKDKEKSPPKCPQRDGNSKQIQRKLKTKSKSSLEMSQLHVEEIVRLSEESQSLDDEDLLEILTCPSPVWWEDPPDDNYIEDPIYTRPPITPNPPQHIIKTYTRKRKRATVNRTTPKTEEIDDAQRLQEMMRETKQKVIMCKQNDDKFMKKRHKLESLLGSIKNKINLDATETVELGCNKISEHNNVHKTEQYEDSVNKINHNNKELQNTEVSRNNKRHSESTEGDDPFSSFRDEDLLKDLENMDIPIEPGEGTPVDKLDDDLSPSNSDNTSFLGSGKDSHTLDPQANQNDQHVTEAKKVHLTAMESTDHKTQGNDKLTDTILTNVPSINKFSITSIEKDTNSSPVSSKSVITDDAYESSSLVSNQDNMDTISDTNIRFIDDDTCSSKTSDTSRNFNKSNNEFLEHNSDAANDHHDNALPIKIVGNVNQFFLNKNDVKNDKSMKLKVVKPKGNKEKTERMTVYKIISRDITKHTNDKQCKNDTIKNTTNTATDTNKVNGKSKTDKEIFNHNNIDSVKTRLDLFFKKFKNTSRKLNTTELKIVVNPDTRPNNVNNSNITELTDLNAQLDVSNGNKDIEKENNTIAFCESCDPKANKSKNVPDSSNVKYCLKCSCIFDSDECTYCVRKAQFKYNITCQNCNIRFCCMSSCNTHEKSHSKLFSCNICSYKADDPQAIVRHRTVHIKDRLDNGLTKSIDKFVAI